LKEKLGAVGVSWWIVICGVQLSRSSNPTGHDRNGRFGKTREMNR
jgi:hypothetical protein